ncbi:hypothetical protein ACUB1S_005461 [Klebsiella michiganensis]
MSDEIETIDKNQKSWAAWKREAERLQAIIDDMALVAMDSDPVAYIGKQWTLVYYTPPMSMGLKIGDKLYRHAQPEPVVDADDNFYSWFGREWAENYQHNQYTTAAKQMLGVMAESAWKAGRRAAMLAAAPQEVKGE